MLIRAPGFSPGKIYYLMHASYERNIISEKAGRMILRSLLLLYPEYYQELRHTDCVQLREHSLKIPMAKAQHRSNSGAPSLKAGVKEDR